MLFILYFLSYLILYFRTCHCLGSKETTTWTTCAYSDCKLVYCYRESCRPSHRAGSLGCQSARRRSMGDILRIYKLWFCWFIFCLSHCSEVCNIILHGPRYNATLLISFMNGMPVLWHVPVCVHGGVGPGEIWRWWPYFCGRKLTALKRHRTVIDWMPCRRPHN